eukprot:gene6058-6760_t
MTCIGNSTTCSDKAGVLGTQELSYCLGHAQRAWVLSLSFLFFFFGFFGNTSVIVVILKSFQDLCLTDLLLVGLAVFDVLGAIFVCLMNFLTLGNLLGSQTKSSCSFTYFMYQLTITISICILLFAVYCLYREIVLRKAETKKKLRFPVFITAAIFLTACESYPLASSVNAKNGSCFMTFASYTSYVLYIVILFILQVIIPLLLFTIMFALMGIELYRAHFPTHAESESADTDVALIVRARSQRKCKFLLVVTSTFYLLFIPLIFMELWFVMDSGPFILSNRICIVYDIFHVIISIKFVVNPVFYYVFYEGFKENFKRIICGWRVGKRYNFMHIKYHFRRDQQEGLVEQDNSFEDGKPEDGNELKDWSPIREQAEGAFQSKLEDRDHDYDDEEDEDDQAVILPHWKNMKSTSSF